MIIGGTRQNAVKFRKLQNGKIVKTVDEQYLRSDIPCGHVSCPMCSFNQSKLIITNIYT